VASQAECAKAVRDVVAMLSALEPETRTKYVLARSVSLRVSDLDVVWSGRLTENGLEDITTAVSNKDDAKAQLRLTTSSDDLIALVAGELSVAAAVAVGKLRVQASPMDLLRLTNLI
jgi:putative sterol carrier protein